MNSGDPANPTFIKVQPSNVQFRARIAPITWGRSGGISHSKASGFPTKLKAHSLRLITFWARNQSSDCFVVLERGGKRRSSQEVLPW